MKHALLLLAAVPVIAVPMDGPALAYPTSLNIVPVADVMDARTMRAELESDGDPTPFSDGAELLLYTQFGLTSRLEVGLDVVGLNTGGSARLNAKWQVLPESDRTPAFAVGLTDVTRSGVLSDWYAVLSRDAGWARLHAGFASDDANRGMFGVEYWPTDRTGLLVDWATGPEAYATVGVYRDTGAGSGALLYYGRNNSDAEWNFVGLNFCWEGAWAH